MIEETNCSLARFTTMKVGGDARRLFTPQNPDELVSLVNKLTGAGEPWFVLGGGSNMLVSSSGIPGSVIRMTQMTEIRPLDNGVIDADAGARLPHLAKQAAIMGLSGLEFAVGIPGTVGGAVVMNAGAHGSCFANVVESALVLDSKTGEVRTFSTEELEFKYRQSVIDASRHVVISAKLRLTPGSADEIQKKTQHNEEYRWRTQPLGFPNLGSTFKNPSPEKPAGMLLDQSGAKELKEGGAAVSAIHANFVINTGSASSEEIVRLLHRMQDKVQSQFGLRLKPEWRILGTFNAQEMEVWESESGAVRQGG